MFWFHCFQVVSLCLHDSSFWILLRVKLSVMGGWRGRGHCVSDQRHGHAQHILIRRWAALLRLVRASHPSPSHFRLSMAFQTFFITSLERAAILTPRVSGSGGTESAGPCRWRTTTTPPPPAPRHLPVRCSIAADPLHSLSYFLCECITVTPSSPSTGDHNTATQHLICQLPKKKRTLCRVALCCMFKLAPPLLRTGSLLHDTQ